MSDTFGNHIVGFPTRRLNFSRLLGNYNVVLLPDPIGRDRYPSIAYSIIRKTCPCNVYPLEPHFYIAKLGFAGV